MVSMPKLSLLFQAYWSTMYNWYMLLSLYRRQTLNAAYFPPSLYQLQTHSFPYIPLSLSVADSYVPFLTSSLLSLLAADSYLFLCVLLPISGWLMPFLTCFLLSISSTLIPFLMSGRFSFSGRLVPFLTCSLLSISSRLKPGLVNNYIHVSYVMYVSFCCIPQLRLLKLHNNRICNLGAFQTAPRCSQMRGDG